MTDDIVRLDVSERNWTILSRRSPDRFLTKHSTTWLLVRFPDGTPTLMTLGYLRGLAVQGFVGLQQIPRECIVQ